MSDVTFSTLPAKVGKIGLITLDRPKALNALTLDMIRGIQSQLETWKEENAIHAVLVKSSSSKAFCAGGDIVSLYREGKDAPHKAYDFFKEEYHLNEYIYDYPKPYICLLDGITMGGGVGISLHGQYPVATENFNFAMPETGIGFFPDVGGSRILSNCHGAMGIYLGLTGKRIGVYDAIEAGLINYAIRSEDQDKFITSLIESDLSKDADISIKALIDKCALTSESSPLKENKSTINHVFNLSNLEEMMATLASVKSEFAEKTLSILKQKSPTSLKVTLKQIVAGKGKSMSECMQMEYMIVKHFIRGHDFYEGVRALLIDKDKMPQWQPNTLTDVTDEAVARYFEPLH